MSSVIRVCLVLLSVVRLPHTAAVRCSDNPKCQCLPKYINCRDSIHLPDVLDSRISPLRDDPPVFADLRGNALSYTVLTRFLLVFYQSLETVILTDQLESVCGYISAVTVAHPNIDIKTDCEVSFVLTVFFFYSFDIKEIF